MSRNYRMTDIQVIANIYIKARPSTVLLILLQCYSVHTITIATYGTSGLDATSEPLVRGQLKFPKMAVGELKRPQLVLQCQETFGDILVNKFPLKNIP